MLVVLFVIAGSRRRVFFVVAFGVDGGKLQRITGDDFELGAAFVALDDLAFVNVIHIDV